eukprot:ctg_3386.g627
MVGKRSPARCCSSCSTRRNEAYSPGAPTAVGRPPHGTRPCRCDGVLGTAPGAYAGGTVLPSAAPSSPALWPGATVPAAAAPCQPASAPRVPTGTRGGGCRRRP